MTKLASSDARAVLALAPKPALDTTLSRTEIAAALRSGGRQPIYDRVADKLWQALRRDQLRQTHKPLTKPLLDFRRYQRSLGRPAAGEDEFVS